MIGVHSQLHSPSCPIEWSDQPDCVNYMETKSTNGTESDPIVMGTKAIMHQWADVGSARRTTDERSEVALNVALVLAPRRANRNYLQRPSCTTHCGVTDLLAERLAEGVGVVGLHWVVLVYPVHAVETPQHHTVQTPYSQDSGVHGLDTCMARRTDRAVPRRTDGPGGWTVV